MPPFVRHGPDFPVEVLQSHEKGRLVLFCGAGVSLGAGLPSFKGLVDLVYRQLGEAKRNGEAAAYRSGAYDRVFELLEQRLGPPFVRETVAKILAPPADVPLLAHQNLLELAQGPDGKHRLITTNFDPLFGLAASAKGFPLTLHRAPFVPVPKPSWSGLVHLHGSLPSGDQPTLHESDLVLSSSDFGRAYLTEGWASRFLRELFREFDVLFVGYSVNDPAVRYLIDALASQRRQGEAFHGAWVLAGVRGGKLESVDRQRWLELGIEPIFYNQWRGHRYLYRSIEEWAYLHRGGLLTLAAWATRKYRLPPDSSREDDARMVIWALADRTGTAARAWADADTTKRERPTPGQSRTALQWLKIFEESERLDVERKGPRLLSSLTPREAPLLNLIGGGYLSGSLPPTTYHLARWLARYLEEDWLIERLLAQRGVVHPEFALLLEKELAQRSVSEKWKETLLKTITGAAYQEIATRLLRIRSNFVLDESPASRLRLVQILEPIPVFREPRFRPPPAEDNPPPPLFEPELALAGFDSEVYLTLRGLKDLTVLDGGRGLAVYAHLLTGLVEQAAEWLNYLYATERQAALSWQAIRSIADEGQDRLGEPDWASLLPLAAASLSGLLQVDIASAQSLFERWLCHGHVLFQRLSLHALSEHPELPAALGVELLLDRSAASLWELFLTRERERFFRMAAGRIASESLKRLVTAILEGPPAQVGETRLTDEARRARERAIWRLLIKLEIGGVQLGQEAVDRLRQIREKFGWTLPNDFRDELLVYSVDVDEEPAVASLLAADLNTLAQLISEGMQVATTRHWGDLARSRPVRALSALRRCSTRGLWPTEYWSEFINVAPFKPDNRPLRLRLLTTTWRLLGAAPKNAVAALLQSLSWLLRAVARDLPETCHEEALHAWDQLWPFAPHESDTILSPTDSFSLALNHPAGHLAEALLELQRAKLPEKAAGIAPEIRKRLEAILAAAGSNYSHPILAAHLPYLFFVDEQWATKHVVPLFDWDHEVAPDAWNAFLYHPRFSPDLLDKLSLHLVETVKRRSSLPDSTSRQVVRLLGVLGVEIREWIPADLQRELVHGLAPHELAELARRLRDLTETDPEGAAQRWRGAIEPWFSTFWPKGKAKRSPEETEALSEMAIETGDAFGEALASVRPFLMPLPESRVADLLSSQKRVLLESRPSEVLDLLDRIVPQAPSSANPWAFLGLDKVLDAVESTSPTLVATPRFRRLRDFVSQS